MGKYIWIFKTVVLLVLSVVVLAPAAYLSYELFVKPNELPPEEASVSASPTPDPSVPELEKALALRKENKPAEAQLALQRFLDNYPFSTRLDDARKALGEVNVEIFFSPIPSPDKIRYQVQRGDALAKIEHKLKVPRELLMRCNRLENPRRLSIGQVLYVPRSEFTVLVERKRRIVTLFNSSRFFKQYTPLQWGAPEPKKGVAPAPLSAQVRQILAWRDGERVSFDAKDYAGNAYWIELSARGFTFYSEEGPKPPKGGIAFPAKEMEELSTLLGKSVPVSIQ